MVEKEPDTKKIQRLETEISNLKDEIKKLKGDLKKSEKENGKLHNSVLESNKSNVYWNKVIGIGTMFFSVLGMIGLGFSIYTYFNDKKKKRTKGIRKNLSILS